MRMNVYGMIECFALVVLTTCAGCVMRPQCGLSSTLSADRANLINDEVLDCLLDNININELTEESNELDRELKAVKFETCNDKFEDILIDVMRKRMEIAVRLSLLRREKSSVYPAVEDDAKVGYDRDVKGLMRDLQKTEVLIFKGHASLPEEAPDEEAPDINFPIIVKNREYICKVMNLVYLASFEYDPKETQMFRSGWKLTTDQYIRLEGDNVGLLFIYPDLLVLDDKKVLHSTSSKNTSISFFHQLCLMLHQISLESSQVEGSIPVQRDLETGK